MRHWTLVRKTALAIATDDAGRSAVSIPAQSRLKSNTVYKMATKNLRSIYNSQQKNWK
jgi:hypothetical protein